MFKVELIGFADALDVEFKRKIKIPGLSNWKAKGAICQKGNNLEKKTFMGERS